MVNIATLASRGWRAEHQVDIFQRVPDGQSTLDMRPVELVPVRDPTHWPTSAESRAGRYVATRLVLLAKDQCLHALAMALPSPVFTKAIAR